MGGAGAGAGGLAMAHHANAVARPAQPTGQPHANIPQGSAPPPSAAGLGADLVDKQQSISLKQVRDQSHMPLVAIDLYDPSPTVATFPPKAKDPSAGLTPSLVGKMKSSVAFQPTEAAHKKLRKWLSKSKGYSSLLPDAIAKPGDDAAVVIDNPQRWLGLRRLSEAPDDLRATLKEEETGTPAIAEEASQSPGVIMANGTLDGSAPQGDDFDRVLYKVRLHESKKTLTVLPEEAVQLILNQAQTHVARKVKTDDDEDEIVQYPCCVAVPAVYCNDSSIEALLDACGGSGAFFQRSLCALAGAVIPGQEGKPNNLLSHLAKVQQAMYKEFQKEEAKNPDAQFEEDVMLLLAGVSGDSAECTAVQVSQQQRDGPCCLFGNYKVLSSVSYQHKDPLSLIDKCVSELFEQLDVIAPEADGPVAMVTYGASESQKIIHGNWDKLKKRLEDWEKVPHFYTKPDCVAVGTAILGAVSHGRLSTVVQIPGKKPKAQLAIRIQNVAPVAVGVRFNYHGGKKGKWLPVKTIFDFDRRVPAGPYQIDLNAAECAVYRGGATKLSEEDLLKAIKDNEGAKGIPKREEAALDLRVQIVQKLRRDSDWTNIGDPSSPLVVDNGEGGKTACEQVALELSLGSTGMITNALVGDRYVLCFYARVEMRFRFFLALKYISFAPAGNLLCRPTRRHETQLLDGIWGSFWQLLSLEGSS